MKIILSNLFLKTDRSILSKKTGFFLLILMTSHAMGQVKKPFSIIPKKGKYVTIDSCSYSFTWDSIKMKNEKTTQTINTSIKSNVYEYLANESYKIEAICDTSMNTSYSFDCKIVFANAKVISSYLYSNVDYQNNRLPDNYFKTLNYSSKSGDIINFNALIIPQKIPEIDTLIIHKMKDIMNEYEINDIENQKYWRKQLNDLAYVLSDDGITVFLKNEVGGYNTNSWKQDIFLASEEIKDFIYDTELLK